MPPVTQSPGCRPSGGGGERLTRGPWGRFPCAWGRPRACGLCVFGGLWPGLAPGAESAWGVGGPSVPAACYAIRRPWSWASTARPGPGRPQRPGSLQRLPAPPSRRPSARVPGPGTAGALMEAPSRPHTLSLWPGFPQTSWPLAVDLGSQPHPSFTPRTWWRAPAGFGALPYP